VRAGPRATQPPYPARPRLYILEESQDAPAERSGDVLADRMIALMTGTGMPNGVGAIGYSEAHLDVLTDRTVAQKRLLDNAPPPPVDRVLLKELFRDALRYW